ncbi:MAG: hypothetical protein ACPF95_03315 [Flavobacteriaceae bacterium]
MNTLKLFILLPLFIASNNPFTSVESQDSAKNYIKLYTEHVGGTAWNWIAETQVVIELLNLQYDTHKGELSLIDGLGLLPWSQVISNT